MAHLAAGAECGASESRNYVQSLGGREIDSTFERGNLTGPASYIAPAIIYMATSRDNILNAVLDPVGRLNISDRDVGTRFETRAVARPMPEAPPVMSTDLDFSNARSTSV